MGKSVTPTNRIELTERKPNGHVVVYKMTWDGRVSQKRLEDWINTYVVSYKVGGCNEHITKSIGYIPLPQKARVVNQFTNEVRATWVAPKFWVF